MDVLINMRPPNGGPAMGTVAIKSNPIGPDALRIMVTGLQINTTHVVMLANSPATGALPVYFAGEFTTDNLGQGFYSADLEVMNAYSGENPGQTNPATGTAPALAGVLANGGLNVPLDFIRIYRGLAAPGGLQTVFTLDGVSPGGAHVLSTDRPIPQENPSAQFLYNVVAMHSMKCVGISSPGPLNGLTAQQAPCQNLAQQAFRFLPTARNSFQLRVSSSLKCLSVRGDSNDDMAPVQQEVCRGLPGIPLQFQLTPAPAPALGYFMIMATQSQKCLEVANSSTLDGAALVQMPCRTSNNANQLFRFTRVDF